MWAFIWKNVKFFTNWKSIRVLFLSLIRLKLLYGSVIWRPCTKNLYELLEKVEHRVIRYLAFVNGRAIHRFDHDYIINRKKYDIPILLSILDVNDSICIYKIMNGITNCKELKSKLPKKSQCLSK